MKDALESMVTGKSSIVATIWHSPHIKLTFHKYVLWITTRVSDVLGLIKLTKTQSCH